MFTKLLVTACLAVFGGVGVVQHVTHVTQVRCEEDQPCWNCHVDGNRICGPTRPGQAG